MTDKNDSFSLILKSASIIMICTIIYKILGFLREFALSYFWGTSGVSDAFLISQTIPGTLFDFVGTGLATCFIPIYYSILSNNGRDKANLFTNKIITIIFTFATFLIITVWIDTPLFIKIFASGFEGETLKLACGFTRVGIMSLYFSALVFVYSSFLQAEKQFFPSSITAVLQSVFVLIFIILGAIYNIWILPIGCALSIGIRLIYLYPCVNKYGLRLRIDFKWKDDNVKKLGLLLLPVMVGVAVNDLNVLVDRTIASQLAVGAISALTYANSLIQLANGGIVQPIATVFYPYITKSITKNDAETASLHIRKTLNVLFVIFVPLCFYFIAFGRDITVLLFGRGAFDEYSIDLTTTAFFYYSFGLCFIGIREVLSRIYYAYGDTKTPTMNAVIGVIFNIALNMFFSRHIGIGGLALATSISALITTLLLGKMLRSKTGISLLNVLDIKELLKSVICASLSIGSAYLLGLFLSEVSLVIKVTILVSVVCVNYFSLAIIIKMQTAKGVVSLLRKGLIKR